MIKPRIGMQVLYHPHPKDFLQSDGMQPCAAIITYVVNMRKVNLAIFDALGNPYNACNVQLLQDGDVAKSNEFAYWPR